MNLCNALFAVSAIEELIIALALMFWLVVAFYWTAVYSRVCVILRGAATMTAVSLIMVFNDIILLACLNMLIQFSQESENAETSVLNEYSV